MWIAENLSKNSINKPTAESGNVVMSEIGNNAIIASGEHIGLDFVTPYGIVSIPPVKEKPLYFRLPTRRFAWALFRRFLPFSRVKSCLSQRAVQKYI